MVGGIGSNPSTRPLLPIAQPPAGNAGNAGNAGHRPPTLQDRLRNAGKSALATGSMLVNDTRNSLPSSRTMGAMAGHALQQAVTCGATTFAREEVFMHAYNAMLPMLQDHGAPALMAAQVAVSGTKIAANLYRHSRLEHPDPEAGVRGHFGLSPQEWQSKTPTEKAALTAEHKSDSRNVTRNEIVADAAFLVMSALSHSHGDGALAARVLATQMRNLTYAASRETLQATLSTTTSSNGTSTHGVNSDHMNANAWTYSAMTLAMGYLQDAVIGHALPAGQSAAGPTVNDEHGKPLTGAALNSAINTVASIRALANTAIETVDAYRGKHASLAEVGDTQKLQTDPSKLLPLKDYERLLDHSPARWSWNNISGALPLALDTLTKGKVSPAVSQFFNNAGAAAMFGLTYETVNKTYNAHAGNRAARAALNTGTTQTTGGQAGVTATVAPAQVRPAPSASAPAQVQPAPSAPAPAQVQPAPSAPAPAQVQPAPSAPAPAQVQPAPSAPAPAQVQPAPSASAPAQVRPAPSATAAAQMQPAPTAPAPAQVQPAPSATAAAPAPVAQPVPAQPAQAPQPAAQASTPGPAKPANRTAPRPVQEATSAVDQASLMLQARIAANAGVGPSSPRPARSPAAEAAAAAAIARATAAAAPAPVPTSAPTAAQAAAALATPVPPRAAAAPASEGINLDMADSSTGKQ
jgi:hypothetical protein